MKTSAAGGSLLEAKGVSKSFLWHQPSRPWVRRKLQAVVDVELEVLAGECLGLVGESGSGKSTLARCLLRLVQPDAGRVLYRGEDLLELPGERLRRLRAELQMVFQDSRSALNPRLRIGTSIVEPLLLHGRIRKAEAGDAAARLLRQVGLSEELARRFPHELSGGQRQRIGIARGLATEPRLLILDEPVSALDVSVQAQILNWLLDLRRTTDLTMVVIAHDMAVVESIADRVAVFYLGRLIELAGCADLFLRPLHPYTRSLMLSIPSLDPKARGSRHEVAGEIPSPLHPPKGCAFHPRCPIARARCRVERPGLANVEGRRVACHFPGEWDGGKV